MNFTDRLLKFLDEVLEKWWNKLGTGDSWKKYVWLRDMIAEAEYFRRALQEIKGDGFWVDLKERLAE